MSDQNPVFVFIGTYPDESSARVDYNVVKALHDVGGIGTYDAAVITKDEDGKVHINKDEMATRHGAWGGAAVGPSSGSCSRPRSSRPPSSAQRRVESPGTSGGACHDQTSRSSGT